MRGMKQGPVDAVVNKAVAAIHQEFATAQGPLTAITAAFETQDEALRKALDANRATFGLLAEMAAAGHRAALHARSHG